MRFASHVGLSVVTVRRYMSYLSEQQLIYRRNGLPHRRTTLSGVFFEEVIGTENAPEVLPEHYQGGWKITSMQPLYSGRGCSRTAQTQPQTQVLINQCADRTAILHLDAKYLIIEIKIALLCTVANSENRM